MARPRPEHLLRCLAALLLALPAIVAVGAWAQLSVRPDDPTGISIREKRTRCSGQM